MAVRKRNTGAMRRQDALIRGASAGAAAQGRAEGTRSMAIIDAVELSRQLVRMNTVNPPGAEEACARHIGKLLEGAGFQTRYHDLAPGRSSLVATIGGSADKKPLCFTGHIDTVPLGAAKWKMDPFAA